MKGRKVLEKAEALQLSEAKKLKIVVSKLEKVQHQINKILTYFKEEPMEWQPKDIRKMIEELKQIIGDVE